MLKVLYNFLTIIFYVPFIFLIIIRKSLKKEHETKFKEKFLKNKIKRPDGFLFWFHAASIGELNTIFPLLEFYLKNDKSLVDQKLSSIDSLAPTFKERLNYVDLK